MSAISASFSNFSHQSTNFGSTAPVSQTETTLLQSTGVKTTQPSETEPANDFIRVSSSIGRTASAGQLSRQEALDIYRQIASFL